MDYQIRVADKFPKILIMECDFLIYFKLRNYMFNKDLEWKEMFDNALENLNVEDEVFIFIH